MPSLRYGRDITDDAAQLQGLITANLERSRNQSLSPEDRARAREIALNSLETVRAVFGNMRTLRLFANEAGQESTGTYTSEGRQAAGLGGTIPVKPPLSKAAHAAYRRLEARGTVAGMQAYDPQDGKSPVRYMPGNMSRAERATGVQVSPRFARAREAARTQGERKLIQDRGTVSEVRKAAQRPGSTVADLRAARERTTEESAKRADRRRRASAKKAAQAAKQTSRPKKSRAPRRPRSA